MRKHDITHEELLAELERLERSDAEGATVQELCDRTGESATKIRAKLQKIAKQGRLIVGRKVVTYIDGRRTPVPCYRVARQPAVKQSRPRKGRKL